MPYYENLSSIKILNSTTIEIIHNNETLNLKTFRGELESILLE